MRSQRRHACPGLLVHERDRRTQRTGPAAGQRARPILPLPSLRHRCGLCPILCYALPGRVSCSIRADMMAIFPPGVNMPTYHIEMLEGRSIEQKKKLVAEITRVSVEVLGGSPESVDILITDVKRENWSTGGKLWSERS